MAMAPGDGDDGCVRASDVSNASELTFVGPAVRRACGFSGGGVMLVVVRVVECVTCRSVCAGKTVRRDEKIARMRLACSAEIKADLARIVKLEHCKRMGRNGGNNSKL